MIYIFCILKHTALQYQEFENQFEDSDINFTRLKIFARQLMTHLWYAFCNFQKHQKQLCMNVVG